MRLFDCASPCHVYTYIIIVFCARAIKLEKMGVAGNMSTIAHVTSFLLLLTVLWCSLTTTPVQGGLQIASVASGLVPHIIYRYT